MKKSLRNPYLIVSATVALTAIALLCGMLFKSRQAEKYYRLQVTNSYRHAFTELVSAVDEMDSALQKTIHSGTPSMMCQTFTEVFGASKAAKQSLSELPKSEGAFEQTSGFITQIGDYAFFLSKMTGSGKNPDDEAMKSLKTLSETTSILRHNLGDMLADVNDGGLTIEEMREIEARASRRSDDVTRGVFNTRIKASEEEFPQIPTLIYDGPYSSHIASKAPQMCEGAEKVTEEDAKARAEKLFGLSGLMSDGVREGNLPVYMFTLPSNDGTTNIEVSVNGGYVVNMYSSQMPQSPRISKEEAIDVACKFVEENITDPLTESYHMAAGNLVTVNFAYTVDDVICYPDLIKVTVSQESGEVTGFEAQGYVMNHHRRNIPSPTVSEEEAREKVSKDLKILSHALAIIPTGGENEVFCHEFKCENGNGQHYITYINAETGAEEQILILIESENGTLTM